MADACARLCTSGLSPRSQSTISVPTRQWRTVPLPGTLRSRIRAEAGDADDAARISVFNTLPIIIALSLGDCISWKERKQNNINTIWWNFPLFRRTITIVSGAIVLLLGGPVGPALVVIVAGWGLVGGDGLRPVTAGRAPSAAVALTMEGLRSWLRGCCICGDGGDLVLLTLASGADANEDSLVWRTLLLPLADHKKNRNMTINK